MEQTRDDLAKLTASIDSGLPASFAPAIEAVFTALEYQDETLRRSAVESAKSALGDMIDDVIAKRVGATRAARGEVVARVEGLGFSPGPESDALGRELGRTFDEHIRSLVGFRDGVVRPAARHTTIARAAELDAEIAAVEALKTAVVGDWPWSDRPVPPFDPATRARSRAAIARGDVVALEDLIRQLGGTPAA